MPALPPVPEQLRTPKRKLKYLILHCTATCQGREVTSEEIVKWHTSPPPTGRGWKKVGYSDMFHLNGLIENLVPYNNDDIVDSWEITNGVAGLNGVSRHVVYVGGLDRSGASKDTRTSQQIITMINYIRHTLAQHPDIKIAGHNQFAQKACPCFDVPKWLREIGIPEKNIYQS
jgi:hypothetical protein